MEPQDQRAAGEEFQTPGVARDCRKEICTQWFEPILASRRLQRQAAVAAQDFELASELLAHELVHVLVDAQRACVNGGNSDGGSPTSALE